MRCETVASYTQIAARSLGVTLQPVEIRTADDFERVFASVLKGRAEALVVGSGQFLFTHQLRIVEFALKNRLPSIYAWKDPVSFGGLIAYGVNIPRVYRRAAYYVDKILRGIKEALGLTIPQSALLRADELIQ